MGGFFGITKRNSECVNELFYGVDYNSHLGTRRAGMATNDNGRFVRSIHNIENTYFRTKFEPDLNEFSGIASFPKGTLSGTVDFTAPSTLFDGTAASGSLDYKVMANGTAVAQGKTSFGAKVSASVTLSQPGDYKFSVTVSNDALLQMIRHGLEGEK